MGARNIAVAVASGAGSSAKGSSTPSSPGSSASSAQASSVQPIAARPPATSAAMGGISTMESSPATACAPLSTFTRLRPRKKIAVTAFPASASEPVRRSRKGTATTATAIDSGISAIVGDPPSSWKLALQAQSSRSTAETSTSTRARSSSRLSGSARFEGTNPSTQRIEAALSMASPRPTPRAHSTDGGYIGRAADPNVNCVQKSTGSVRYSW